MMAHKNISRNTWRGASSWTLRGSGRNAHEFNERTIQSRSFRQNWITMPAIRISRSYLQPTLDVENRLGKTDRWKINGNRKKTTKNTQPNNQNECQLIFLPTVRKTGQSNQPTKCSLQGNRLNRPLRQKKNWQDRTIFKRGKNEKNSNTCGQSSKQLSFSFTPSLNQLSWMAYQGNGVTIFAGRQNWKLWFHQTRWHGSSLCCSNRSRGSAKVPQLAAWLWQITTWTRKVLMIKKEPG